jgi:hypothetical protein
MTYTDLKEPGYYTRVWSDGDCYVFYFNGKSAKDFRESNTERVLTIRGSSDINWRVVTQGERETLIAAEVAARKKAVRAEREYHKHTDKLLHSHFNFMP